MIFKNKLDIIALALYFVVLAKQGWQSAACNESSWQQTNPQMHGTNTG